MDSRLTSPGFIATQGALSCTASSFCGTAVTPLPQAILRLPRRAQRARFVSSGDVPKPSSDPEPEESIGKDAEEAASESVEEVTAEDILSSPAFLKKKLEIVQKELIEAKEALEQDSEAVTAEKDKYVRLAADFENFRRRSVEDLRKQDAKSTAKVCKEILGVLDNFERATAAVTANTENERAISSSYQAINKQLLNALVKLKVEPVDAVGEVFDPELHEAIQRMDSTEYAEDTVCAQYQRGYKIGDFLIRAAVVAVSSGPGPDVMDGAAPDEGEVVDLEVEPAVATMEGDAEAGTQ